MIHLNLVHFSVIYYLTNTALFRQWYTTWDKLSTPAFNASLALVTTANNGLDAACKESQENRMIAAHGYSGDCKRPPNRTTDDPRPEIFISLNNCLKQITKVWTQWRVHGSKFFFKINYPKWLIKATKNGKHTVQNEKLVFDCFQFMAKISRNLQRCLWLKEANYYWFINKYFFWPYWNLKIKWYSVFNIPLAVNCNAKLKNVMYFLVLIIVWLK